MKTLRCFTDFRSITSIPKRPWVRTRVKQKLQEIQHTKTSHPNGTTGIFCPTVSTAKQVLTVNVSHGQRCSQLTYWFHDKKYDHPVENLNSKKAKNKKKKPLVRQKTKQNKNHVTPMQQKPSETENKKVTIKLKRTAWQPIKTKTTATAKNKQTNTKINKNQMGEDNNHNETTKALTNKSGKSS